MAASQIVTTLKNKIKESDDELARIREEAEENREKYLKEKKEADEVEADLLALNRKVHLLSNSNLYPNYVFLLLSFHLKIVLLEDRKEKVDERLRLTTNQLDAANSSLETAKDGREVIENKYENTSDKIEELERLVAEAKATAQEADKRCEDVVR